MCYALDMKEFVYVQAHWLDGMLSFRHCFVTANNAEEAYDAGNRELTAAEVEAVNDYVVELP